MTQLTLKEAHRITKEIGLMSQKLAGEIAMGTMTVSIYSERPLEVSIKLAADKVISNYKAVKALGNCKFAIRRAIQKANEQCGINEALTQEASVKEFMGVVTGVAQYTVFTEDVLNEMQGKLAAMKASQVDHYRMETMRLDAVLSESQIATIAKSIKTAKKDLTAIADKCAALNVSTKIDISDEHDVLLNTFGLI